MSTLKVDTYLTRGGASEIAIDKLKGVTAASSIDVVGEGGTTTTNLQQGLVKSWSSQVSQAILDSFNVSSMTDVSAGQVEDNFTNVFSNALYSSAGSSGGSAAARTNLQTNWYTSDMWTTSLSRTGHYNDGASAYEDNDSFVHRCGDLA